MSQNQNINFRNRTQEDSRVTYTANSKSSWFTLGQKKHIKLEERKRREKKWYIHICIFYFAHRGSGKRSKMSPKETIILEDTGANLLKPVAWGHFCCTSDVFVLHMLMKVEWVLLLSLLCSFDFHKVFGSPYDCWTSVSSFFLWTNVLNHKRTPPWKERCGQSDLLIWQSVDFRILILLYTCNYYYFLFVYFICILTGIFILLYTSPYWKTIVIFSFKSKLLIILFKSSKSVFFMDVWTQILVKPFSVYFIWHESFWAELTKTRQNKKSRI